MSEADRLRALLECYVAALRELRAWNDPAVIGLVARLERRLVEVDSALGSLPITGSNAAPPQSATLEPQAQSP